MTTPDGPSDSPERITRPDPARDGPIRSGAAPAAAAPAGETPNATIDATVAKSVKSAYDVLSQTIEQGRKSAEHFRQGQYNMRDVPEDVRHLAERMLGLARQLSNSTFDVCEALLRQAPAAGGPPPPGATHVPPFQTVKPIGAPAPHAVHPSPAPAAAPAMRLAVRFAGARKAIAHTTSLARPTVPASPADVKCARLDRLDGEAPPITSVAFEADLVEGGLIATVTVGDDHAPGTYSGTVYTTNQPLPLGLLVVELTR